MAGALSDENHRTRDFFRETFMNISVLASPGAWNGLILGPNSGALDWPPPWHCLAHTILPCVRSTPESQFEVGESPGAMHKKKKLNSLAVR